MCETRAKPFVIRAESHEAALAKLAESLEEVS